MALEKFIRGKVDDCNHVGKRANVRRLEAAIEHQQNWQEEVVMEPAVEYVVGNRQRHQENLNLLHGVYYHGSYYHHGRPQKNLESFSEHQKFSS